MAKQPRTTIVPAPQPLRVPSPAPEAPVNGDAIDQLAEPDKPLESEIMQVMAELGEGIGEAFVNVSRWSDNFRAFAFVARFVPSEFSVAKIHDQFGGGKFNIRLYVPKTFDGRAAGVQLEKNTTIFLEGPAKVVKPAEPEATPAAPDVATVLAQTMREGFLELGKLIVEARPAPVDPIAQFRQFAELQALLRGPESKEKPRDTLRDFLEFRKLDKEIFGNVAGVPKGAGENAMLVALGRDFLEMFKNRLPAQPAADAPALPAPGDNPAPGNVVDINAARPADIKVPPTPADAERELMVSYVKMLTAFARQNTDVQPIAQKIYEESPKEFVQQLFSKNADGSAFDWLGWLAVADPDVKLHRVWFERLHKAIWDLDNAAG